MDSRSGVPTSRWRSSSSSRRGGGAGGSWSAGGSAEPRLSSWRSRPPSPRTASQLHGDCPAPLTWQAYKPSSDGETLRSLRSPSALPFTTPSSLWKVVLAPQPLFLWLHLQASVTSCPRGTGWTGLSRSTEPAESEGRSVKGAIVHSNVRRALGAEPVRSSRTNQSRAGDANHAHPDTPMTSPTATDATEAADDDITAYR